MRDAHSVVQIDLFYMLFILFSLDSSARDIFNNVQQQELHLLTTTVREALTFSALLQQLGYVSREEKLKYVDEVIDLLDMELYAEAVVGVPSEGLNVEQRKSLTIGVELAAKPQLLLFLDEPTSGLNSQTSWIMCNLMEKPKKKADKLFYARFTNRQLCSYNDSIGSCSSRRAVELCILVKLVRTPRH
jgi:ABC-type multidrug transport system ATPase subunit